jgi:Asp-tRNA(Asn)/Glu-tRNA(Gln) amidotransferase A subunit family amidase
VKSLIHRLPLVEMASLARSGAVSSYELVEALLERIETVNPHYNAFTMVLPDQARASARRADQGLKMGPLHGVPLTVKDSYDVAGLPTRLGSFFAPEAPASEDSAVVQRLRRAGAIIIGKTNTPEFLTSYETDNFITGRSNNPWNVERTPGGSSGGEAAAIASGCSPGGVGTDGGGSIRVPAHFCGIAGLKPTPGRISLIGHRPAEAATGIAVAGPMARSVADVRLLFEVLAGYDDRDPWSAPVELRSPKIDGARIGVFEAFYDIPVQPAVRAAVKKAADLLAGLGFAVDSFRPEGLERAPNLWSFFFAELPAPASKERIAGREQEAHWTYRENLDRLLERPPAAGWQVIESLAARDRMRRGLVEQMRNVPFLLLPVSSIAAFKHRERKFSTEAKSVGLFQAMMPVTAFNLLGFPALTVPLLLDEEGMPVGVQIVARPWEEEALLELGVALEAARGTFQAPPEPYNNQLQRQHDGRA